MTKEVPHQDERSLAAEQVREARRGERGGRFYYRLNRNANQYLYDFEGLKYFFKYVLELGTSSTVLDIGAGTTRAIFELSQMDIAEGLNFLATVINRVPEIEQFLGHERTISTSAEVLRRIPEGSIGGILAMKSITYSIAPRLVIQRFDEVLVPGGAIKATFGCRYASSNKTKSFLPYLNELGYDHHTVVVDPETNAEEIMLAIKPGGVNTVTARDLLRRDYVTRMEQLGGVLQSE